MKNFVDKLLLLLTVFLMVSCNDCKGKKESYINELSTLSRVKNSLNLIAGENTYNLSSIETIKTLSQKDLSTLSKLGLYQVVRKNKSFIFSFNKAIKDDIIGKELDEVDKFCEIHLIYTSTNEDLGKIINFEQYSECRIELDKITLNWTYILQFKNCD